MATFENSQSNSIDVSESPWTPLSSGRLGVGVFYGVLLGTIYALVTQIVDVVTFTDLPLRTDWSNAIGLIVTAALSGAGLGVVVSWPQETWKGILAGATAIAAWGLLKSALEIAAFVLLFVPTLLPLILMGAPIAAVLRLTINWHNNLAEESGLRRIRGLALLLAGVVAVAAFAGSWARMPGYAEEAVRKVDRVIQFAIQNPDNPLSFSLRDVPQIKAHLNSDYTIVQVPVTSTSTGVEVNVRFDDGFSMSCLVGQQGDIPYCQEGWNVFSAPGQSGQ
jgi:hypothetical protein